MLLGIIAVGIISFVVINSGKDLLTSASRALIVTAIEESQIDETQQTALIFEIDRITNAFKEDQIDLDQLGAFAESITQTPTFEALLINAIHTDHVANSDFAPEAKEASQLTLHRITRGYLTEKISRSKMDELLELVSYDDTSAEIGIKESLTNKEIASFLNAADVAADEAGISRTYEPIDFASPIRKIVDEMLEGSATQLSR